MEKRELAEKKKTEDFLSEMERNGNLLIKYLESILRDYKPKTEHSYRLKDEVSLNRLESSIAELSSSVRDMPEEIKVTKEIVFEKGTRKFLWWYFGLSTPIMAFLICLSVWFYQDKKKANVIYSKINLIKKHNSLSPLGSKIKVDGNGFYYLDFIDSDMAPKEKGFIQNHTEFKSLYKNGKYNKKIRVFLGKK